jgi:hypothetical protein
MRDIPKSEGEHFQFRAMKFFSVFWACAVLSLPFSRPKNLLVEYSTIHRDKMLRNLVGHGFVSQIYTKSLKLEMEQSQGNEK